MTVRLIQPAPGQDEALRHQVLQSLYEAVQELRRNAVREPLVVVGSFAELRKTRGTVDGPTLAVATGYATIADGGEAAFAWDPTLTDADDDSTVIAVLGVAVGRWRLVAL